MEGQSSWDWGPGKRRIQKTAACSRDVVWMEEPLASPDGEKIASVVNLENAVFGLCVNGDLLEQTFEKVWGLSFSPDGRLAAIASTDAEWTVVVDGSPGKHPSVLYGIFPSPAPATGSVPPFSRICVTALRWTEIHGRTSLTTLPTSH
jgi:hypothetical protein